VANKGTMGLGRHPPSPTVELSHLAACIVGFQFKGQGRGVEEKRKSGVPEKRGKGNNARGNWGIDAR